MIAQTAIATASISTSIRGSISAPTSTIVITGRTVAEDLAVGAADLLGARDVGHVARASGPRRRASRPRATELVLDLAQDLDGLLVGGLAEDASRRASTEVVPPIDTRSPRPRRSG